MDDVERRDREFRVWYSARFGLSMSRKDLGVIGVQDPQVLALAKMEGALSLTVARAKEVFVTFCQRTQAEAAQEQAAKDPSFAEVDVACVDGATSVRLDAGRRNSRLGSNTSRKHLWS
ncbi:hypothetical protein JCM10296v2_001293 [Rhodotorula toruloides]